MNFSELGISSQIISGLKKQNITNPTKVQEDVIEKIINNKNLIVQSETGSGKTLAYLTAIFESLRPVEKGMKVIVLVPTHELAMQVHRQVELLSKNSNIDISSTTIFGDVNIKRQIEKLKYKPQIIIGTSGRILELIKKRKISAHTIKTIVIDEADKMLDKNNISSVESILKSCMRDTQVLLFSASIHKDTIKTAQGLAVDLELIKISQKLEIPQNIEHIYLLAEKRDKIEMLRKVIKSLNPQKALIFINKLNDIEEATEKLKYHHYSADCLHGSKFKNERKNVIEDFAKGRLKLLIATDIAARGLHIDGITTVIHLSIPEDASEYLHRAGRTGRDKKKGLSISIVTKEELALIKGFQKSFGINILHKRMNQGKIIEG